MARVIEAAPTPLECALLAAYEDAARAAGDILAARVFAARPDIALDAMTRAAAQGAAMLANLTLAAAEIEQSMRAQRAVIEGEQAPRAFNA